MDLYIVVYISIAILLLTLFIKIYFWWLIPNKRSSTLFRSFKRYYSLVDIHDSDNTQVRTFRNVSNICNIFHWIAFATLVVIIYFTVTQVPKALTR